MVHESRQAGSRRRRGRRQGGAARAPGAAVGGRALQAARRRGDEINRRFDDFLQAEIADTGKPRTWPRTSTFPRGAANFKIFTDTIKNVADRVVRDAHARRQDRPQLRRAHAARRDRVVCPWNLPLLLMTWKVGPALACGNTVVVKPSEETPATATLLGEVMNKVGMPKGVYNVVHGFGVDSAGEFLTAPPGRQRHHLHRRDRTGTAIMKAGADGIRPVSLELGGKNAAVVFADCDFDNAVATAHPLVLRERRPGLPGHRARVRGAPDLREGSWPR
jgi:aminomuconate-semialdehyde/2-hydroxymuconate-6-semialdehyde dehydrogenase